MTSVKLFDDPGLSLDDDEGDDRPDTEPDGETVVLPVFYQTDSPACNPYLPFSDSISTSDSGSISCPGTGADPDSSFIDLFDRESYEVDALQEFYSDPDPGLSIVDDFNLWGFHDAEEGDVEEIGLGLGVGSGSGSDRQGSDSGGQGLQVTGLDSDSDFEDGNGSHNENGETESGRIGDGSGLSPVWDRFYGEEEAVVVDEELDEGLEWEEVQNAITWTPESGQAIVTSESQVGLAIHNVVNYIEQAEGISLSAAEIELYLANIIEYSENHGDYDAIFGQMFDNEIGIRGSPPAAKRVVEDLSLVELTAEELGKGDIFCAICKDEMVIEEKVRRLPCRHFYHGDCVLPWLGIRNTCPVCRYELPTDDPEYERTRRQQRSDGGLAM